MKKVIFNKYRMLTAQAPLWRLHSLTAGVLARSYTTEFRNLQQGGRLVVDMTAFDSASLKISSAWQDHCTLELGSEAEADALEIFEVADDNTLSIAASQRSASNQDAPQLSIFIPEYFDVHIRANQIDLELLKKVIHSR